MSVIGFVLCIVSVFQGPQVPRKLLVLYAVDRLAILDTMCKGVPLILPVLQY